MPFIFIVQRLVDVELINIQYTDVKESKLVTPKHKVGWFGVCSWFGQIFHLNFQVSTSFCFSDFKAEVVICV